jgi:hypothetical protein
MIKPEIEAEEQEDEAGSDNAEVPMGSHRMIDPIASTEIPKDAAYPAHANILKKSPFSGWPLIEQQKPWSERYPAQIKEVRRWEKKHLQERGEEEQEPGSDRHESESSRGYNSLRKKLSCRPLS